MEAVTSPSAILNKPCGYSLKDTLECGQCFRYESYTASDGQAEYYIIASGKAVCLREDGEHIYLYGCPADEANFWSHYLALDIDWPAINREVAELCGRDSLLAEAARMAGGLAILRQDPTEALLSFIVSQNNNIPRIRKIIRRLSAAYGHPLFSPTSEGKCPTALCEGTVCDACGACYTFPTPEEILAAPERLSQVGLGFRVRYILDAAEKLASGQVDLEAVRSCGSLVEAERMLCTICGVGKKVADCTLLFSLGYTDAFPIDVWIAKAKSDYIGDRDPATLGRYAGIAQQYIYHHARNITPKA